MKKKGIFHQYAGAFFWASFILLNALIFLPPYLVNIELASFWPTSTLGLGEKTGKFLLVLTRDNMDLFRLSADLVIIVVLLFLIRKFSGLYKWMGILATVFYLLMVYYQAYYAVSLKLYGQHPFFLNDFVLLKEVVPIFLGQITGGENLQIIWVAIGFLAISVLLMALMRILVVSIKHTQVRVWMKILAGLVLLGIGLTTWRASQTTYRPDFHTVQWTSQLMMKSLDQKNANKLKSLDQLPIYEDYYQKPLKERPDIYFLFIESYGRAAAAKTWLIEDYANLTDTLNSELSDEGWNSASAYSIAPILGGRSWLSFTTVLSGVKVEDHLQYTDLIEIHYAYPHLMRYLKTQGYMNYRMKTMSKQKESTKVAYTLADRYFAFDEWLKHGDFPYKGFEFDFNGGIPDQYALNYFHDEFPRDTTAPNFLFFITMGSHWPWFPPAPLQEDWRALDTLQSDPYNIYIPDSVTSRYGKFMARLEEKIGHRYFNTIAYDLKVVKDFIVKQADENSIFVVLGDHQPPTLTYYGGDSLETQVHIISKNKEFVEGFVPYGFDLGMEPDTNKVELKHEGLYSLFMRQLLTHYGDDVQELPEFLPDGIK